MSDMDYEVAHGIAQIENAKLRAEVERLRKRAANAEDTVLGQFKEIERLRAMLEECRPYVANASHWDVALIASIDAALSPSAKSVRNDKNLENTNEIK